MCGFFDGLPFWFVFFDIGCHTCNGCCLGTHGEQMRMVCAHDWLYHPSQSLELSLSQDTKKKKSHKILLLYAISLYIVVQNTEHHCVPRKQSSRTISLERSIVDTKLL